MSNPEIDSNQDDNDIFSLSLTTKELDNQRSAVRYIKPDTDTKLKVQGWFSFSKDYPAKLLDISSKGATIMCDKSLSLNNKILLNLTFNDKKKFTIAAKIIHKANDKKTYGIKFDAFNNELGDHLVSSPKDLVFK